MRKIKVGDIVSCRYFNTPERKFYGNVWEAEVIAIGGEYEPRPYLVKKVKSGYQLSIARKEIKRVLAHSGE